MRERLAELEGLESAVAMMGLDPIKLARFARETAEREPFHSATLLSCVRLDEQEVRARGLSDSGLQEYRRRYQSLTTQAKS